MIKKKRERELKPIIYIIGIFNGLGNTLIENFYQFLAILLGSAGVIQGLLTSVRYLGSALLTPIYGRLSDYYGRRRFLTLGNFLLSIVVFTMPFAPNALILLILLVILTLINALVTPSWIGLLGDLTGNYKPRRGRIIGKLGFFVTWGASIGLILVSVHMSFLDSSRKSLEVLRIPFFIATTAYLIATGLVWLIPVDKTRKKPLKIFPSLSSIKKNSFPKPYKRFLLIDAIFIIAWSSAWPIFPYVTFNVINSWLDIALMALFTAFFVAFSQSMSGNLIDRIGKKNIIVFARLFLVLPPILYALAAYYDQMVYIYLTNIVVGAGNGAAGIAISTFILDSAPEENRASYQSLHSMVTGLTAFFGSLMMGLLLQILLGNTQPDSAMLISLLLFCGFFRLILWTGYLFMIRIPNS